MKKTCPPFVLTTAAALLVFLASCGDTAVRTPGETDARIAVMEEKLSGYFAKGLRDSMILTANEALPLLDADSMALRRGSFLAWKGTALSDLGRYDSASFILYEALKIAETFNDPPLLMRVHNYLGIHYFNLGKLGEAVESYQKTLAIARRENDSVNIIFMLNNLGNAYMTVGKDFDSAVPYLRECIKVSREFGHDHAHQVASVNLAQILLEQNKLDEAEQMIGAVGKNRGGNYYIDFTEGLIFSAKGEYDKAIPIFKRMLDMKLNSRELYLTLMTQLAEMYEKKGDPRQALDYRKRYQSDRDSLHTIEREKIVQELKVSYETEKKETRIAALEDRNRLVTRLGIATGAALLLALVAFVFLRRWMVQKKALAEQQIKQLEQEKQLIATQAVLDGEVQERTRLARDLHDGLGSILAAARYNFVELKKSTAAREPLNMERYDMAVGLLDDSIHEMRRVAHHLMPDALARFGLKTALSDFCDTLPAVKFLWYGSDARPEPNLEAMIYRTVHELVHNALKHARAAQIIVQIIRDPDRIAFTVQDDGCGFDPAKQTAGMGLTNIRNRVAAFGGIIHIASSNEGTEINIELRIEN